MNQTANTVGGRTRRFNAANNKTHHGAAGYDPEPVHHRSHPQNRFQFVSHRPISI
jgi:hypothetical protein